MEDFLSIVIVILIAVAGAARKNKKKSAKKVEPKGAVKFGPDMEKGFGEMKEFIKEVGKTVLEMDEDDDEYTAPAKMKPATLKAKPVKTAKPVRQPSVIEEGMPAQSGQGRSLFEDQGCVSGSIAHDSHEGDSNYPYGASEGTYRENGDSPYAEDIVHELQSMNVQRLRRAVVVSEILDRPKALRRR